MRKTAALTLAVLALGLVLADRANAQSSATATSTASIVNGLQINKVNDLRFGFIIPTGTPGTVTVAPSGTRSATGGPAPTSGGAVGSASFDVNGTGTLHYGITLPDSISINDGSGHSMTVDSFVSTPSGTGQLAAGYQSLVVGATLHVAAGQAYGAYTGTFDVSVAYN